MRLFSNRRSAAAAALALLAFSGLLALHLRPLPLHPATGTSDVGDALLVSWIIDWVQSHIFAAPGLLYQGNIFYPHPNTLTFSETLIPLALASFPVRWLSRNPLLVYNVLFFLAYVLTGWLTYLLVRRLTGSAAGGLLAGTAFAFNAYMIDHVPHLQLLSVWFVPLAFLFLDRFLEKKRPADAAVFGLAVAAQGLTCIYYGLFLAFLLAVGLPAFWWIRRKELRPRDLAVLGGSLAAAGAVLLVSSIPYAGLMRRYGFARSLNAGADLAAYVAAVPRNLAWGRLLSRFGRPEGHLFIGFTALALALAFVATRRDVLRGFPRWFRFGAPAAAALGLSTGVLVAATGGFRVGRLPFRMIADTYEPSAFLFLAACAALVAAAVVCAGLPSRAPSEESRRALPFAWMGAWALAVSFGGRITVLGSDLFAHHAYEAAFTPFRTLYRILPPFRGIREPGRCGIFALFALAILAGFGVKALSRRIRPRALAVGACAALLVVLNLELVPEPFPFRPVPSGRDAPPTYRWLKTAAAPGDPLLELPVPEVANNNIYQYYSTVHRLPLVNGFSGFIPPAAWYLQDLLRVFPRWGGLDALRELGVKRLVWHRNRDWRQTRGFNRRRKKPGFAPSLRPVQSFRYPAPKERLGLYLGSEDVFELSYASLAPAAPEAPGPAREIPLDGWKLKASVLKETIGRVVDRDPNTRWTTGRPSRFKDAITVELPEARPVTRVRLCLHENDTLKSAVSLMVSTSADGESWTDHPRAYSPGKFVRGLIDHPTGPRAQDMELDGTPVRFIRVALNARSASPWSVSELRLYEKD